VKSSASKFPILLVVPNPFLGEILPICCPVVYSLMGNVCSLVSEHWEAFIERFEMSSLLISVRSSLICFMLLTSF